MPSQIQRSCTRVAGIFSYFGECMGSQTNTPTAMLGGITDDRFWAPCLPSRRRRFWPRDNLRSGRDGLMASKMAYGLKSAPVRASLASSAHPTDATCRIIQPLSDCQLVSAGGSTGKPAHCQDLPDRRTVALRHTESAVHHVALGLQSPAAVLVAPRGSAADGLQRFSQPLPESGAWQMKSIPDNIPPSATPWPGSISFPSAGELEIESSVSAGTTIVARIPLEPQG